MIFISRKIKFSNDSETLLTIDMRIMALLAACNVSGEYAYNIQRHGMQDHLYQSILLHALPSLPLLIGQDVPVFLCQ